MTQDSSSVTFQKIEFGVLESFEILVNGKKKTIAGTPLVEGIQLFLAGRASGLYDVRRRMVELKVGDLLEPKYWHGDNYVTDSLARILIATGAARATIETHEKASPKAVDNFDLKNSEAWFLSNFIFYYSRAFDAAATFEDRLPFAIALGRLIEWWRWRSSGFDKMAVGKRRSESSIQIAAAARKDAAAANEPEWWDGARLDAEAIHKKHPKKSRSEVAGSLAEKHRHSARQIQKVIKPVWQR